MRNILIAALALLQIPSAFAIETGPVNTVYRMPSGTGRPKFGSINLALPAVVGTSVLPVPNGGLGSATFTSNGVLYGSGSGPIGVTTAGAAYQPFRVPSGGGTPAFGAIDVSQSAAVTGVLPIQNGGADSSHGIQNLGLTSINVVAPGRMLSFTGKDGSAISSTNPVRIGFRDSGNASGEYTYVTLTSPVTLTIPDGASWGLLPSKVYSFYIYALNSGGTVHLGVSLIKLSEETVQSSASIGTGVDGDNGGNTGSFGIYSTVSGSVRARLVGKMTFTTGSTWTSATANWNTTSATPASYSVLSLGPFKPQVIQFQAYRSGAQAISGPDVSNVVAFDEIEIDTVKGWDSVNKRYYAPVNSFSTMSGRVVFSVGTANTHRQCYVLRNASTTMMGDLRVTVGTTFQPSCQFTKSISVGGGQFFDMRAEHNDGASQNTTNGVSAVYFSILTASDETL